MKSKKINKLTITEAHNKLVKKEISSEELTQACLDQIKKIDPKIRAFITITEKEALNQARLVDQKISTGKKIKFLEGIPVALKDNLMTEGIKTTCASQILANYIATYNATVVAKLKKEGAVILGKTNMDEFAMGASGENSSFFETKNPWNFRYVPGGSSGGSAAAVASDMCIYALGSDTGGSVRQPASFCGVVGIKPTYGRVSRYGLVAMASSLDQIGPITKSVKDSALVLNIIAGLDSYDSTTGDVAVPDYIEYLNPVVKDLKIGIPKEYFEEGIDPEVKGVIKQALKKLEGLGVKLEETSLPYSKYALATYYILVPAEVSANLARFEGIRYGVSLCARQSGKCKDLLDVYLNNRAHGLGDEVRRRIILGTFVLSKGYYEAFYHRAQKVRALVKQDFDQAFSKYTCLVAPTCPTPAFRIGEKIDDPLAMYMSDILTCPANIAGIPALSLPCGFVKGLPVGLQIIGKEFDEDTILKVAYAYEQATDWHKKKPRIE